MASVYKAFEPDLDRYVALKILPSEFATDRTFGERFNREAKMVAKLEHPNILPIFSYGIQGGVPWMAMRLVGGGNLAALAGGKPLPPRRAVEIIEGVAEALDYAHGKGVIHRDVKPQNILLDEAGRVYLVDFGIARMTEGAQRLTQAGLVAGTPTYMAPEQASGAELDARVDIYSLGIVAYELFTGRPPFQAAEPMDVLMKQVSDPVPVPPRGSVPDGVIEPLMRCLAKRPEDRWPSAGAFAGALRKGVQDSESDGAADDYEPTIAMERPDFSDMGGADGRSYEPTVLSSRVVSPPGGPLPPKAPTYEPTVFSARPSGAAPKPEDSGRYEPTVLVPRATPVSRPAVKPGAGAPPNETKNSNSGLKIAAALLVGFGLLIVLGGVAAYSWWTGRNSAATEPVQPAVLAQASAENRPLPPAPEGTPQPAAEPAADAPADPAQQPQTPQAGDAPVGPNPAGAAPAPTAAAPKAAPQPARDKGTPAVTRPPVSKQPQADATARPDASRPATPEAEPSQAEAPSPVLEAVPEASRSWTNAAEAERTGPLQYDRSIDIGVRVAGVPVDRVYITAKDARSGIKKLFKKSTDKKRFQAEFLLNCPKDGSRPKLRFEVELQKAEGGVLERLSESKNCEGHIRLTRDVATSILDDARKVRIRVRLAG